MELILMQLAMAATAIILGGAFLTRFADAIAELTGLGRLLVGSILLAGATSLPELAVDISAVRAGMANLAVGDLVGSSLFNLLILGVLDLSHHSAGQMFSRSAAVHALSGTASITLTALAVVSILVSHRWPNLVVGSIGVGSLVILLVYVLVVRLVYYDQRTSAAHVDTQGAVMTLFGRKLNLRTATVGFIFSAGIVVVAGPFMADAAGELAERTGLGNTFVGSTLVAFCTSLPELVATATAVRIGAFDMAIGNIYGSNAFNMVLFVPLDLVSPGSLLAGVSQTHAMTGLFTILITSIAVMGQLYRVENRRLFIEPDALVVILLVVTAVVLIYLFR